MHTDVNKRIKIIRKSLKLNQLEFAQTLGLTQAGYSLIENGKNNISSQTMMLLKKIHNINISWLEHGKGEMFITIPKEIKEPSLELDTKDKMIEMLNSERELYIKLIESKDKIIDGLEQRLKKT